MSEVKVTPERLKIIVGLGCIDGGVATAEELEHLLNIPFEVVINSLDGLLLVDVVGDVDVEEFYLTERGSELFHAIYEATGSVVGGG